MIADFFCLGNILGIKDAHGGANTGFLIRTDRGKYFTKIMTGAHVAANTEYEAVFANHLFRHEVPSAPYLVSKDGSCVFKNNGIEDYIRHTVSYCQYGSKIMKPTDIWTNCKEWNPRPICKPGAPCHERAGRGSKTGVQGIYNLEWEKARGNSAKARGVIPPEIFEEILL